MTGNSSSGLIGFSFDAKRNLGNNKNCSGNTSSFPSSLFGAVSLLGVVSLEDFSLQKSIK
jgi:hypothetical protein